MTTICASSSTLDGLDVSHYQGPIDWGAVAASGKRFAFARCSDGTGVKDTQFTTNWAAIPAAGMIRGVYQFFRPTEDPIAQAELLLSMASLQDGDLPPVIDVETMDGASPGAVTAAVQAWLGRIAQELGSVSPILYTAPGFWQGLGNPSAPASLWVANWGVSCPNVPDPWGGWQFWQSSESGSVSGISGAVDLDSFNGAEADLQAAVLGGSPAGGGVGQGVGLALLGLGLGIGGAFLWEKHRNPNFLK